MSVHTSFKYYDEALDDVYLLWAQLLPYRCSWQRPDGVITACDVDVQACRIWNSSIPQKASMATPDHFARLLKIREGGISEFSFNTTAAASFFVGQTEAAFYVKAIYNENHAIRHA